MYAIIAFDGRQHRIEPGMLLDVNRLDAAPGQTITLKDCVLLAAGDDGVQVGAPVIAGAEVDIEVVEHFRGPKVVVFKMKRRKRYRRKQGHRQELTRVRVTAVRLPGREAQASEAEESSEAAEAPTAQETT